MKIPFNIKFRPQIESDEYKVETFSGYPVTIYRWDFDDGEQTPIMGSYVFEDGKEYVGAWNGEGHFDLMSPNDLDLIIITPEPELSEDERIRKSLLAYIKGESKYLDTKKWIAYLEKQKEQKPAEWSEEDEEMRDSIIDFIKTGNVYKHSRLNMKVWLKYLRPQPKQ